MGSRPSEDDVVRQLDGAYDAGRLPMPVGPEFLAEVQARAMSGWVVRVGVVAAVVLAVIIGALVYRVVTTPGASSRDPALDDPGPGPRTQAPAREPDPVLSILSGR